MRYECSGSNHPHPKIEALQEGCFGILRSRAKGDPRQEAQSSLALHSFDKIVSNRIRQIPKEALANEGDEAVFQ